jgi:L-gulonolactone oxidase
VTRRRAPSRGGAGERWRNWAGNQRTDPVRTVTAHDTGEVVAAVKDAARDGLRLKAIGSGHSFTAIAVPDDVAVRAPSDPRLLQVDATGLATVPAGMTLRTLNPLLSATSTRKPSRAPSPPARTARAPDTGGSPTRCAPWSS